MIKQYWKRIFKTYFREKYLLTWDAELEQWADKYYDENKDPKDIADMLAQKYNLTNCEEIGLTCLTCG